RLAGRERLEPDQSRVLHRGLPMFDGFTIDRIADHFDERGDARIFGDEAMIPALVGWSYQHQFEPALPDHLAAKTDKYRAAVAAIGRIGFRAGRGPPVRISGAVEQPDQIEHVDRPFAIVVSKLGEHFLCRIDM